MVVQIGLTDSDVKLSCQTGLQMVGRLCDFVVCVTPQHMERDTKTSTLD